MHDSAFFAFLVFVLCAAPLVLAVDARAEFVPADAQDMAAQNVARPAEYARSTRAQKLESCMALWEPETHMTKRRWKSVCKRLETKD